MDMNGITAYKSAVLASTVLLGAKYIWQFARIPKQLRTADHRQIFWRSLVGIALLALSFLAVTLFSILSGVAFIVLVPLVFAGFIAGTVLLTRGVKQGMTVFEDQPPPPHRSRADRRQQAR